MSSGVDPKGPLVLKSHLAVEEGDNHDARVELLLDRGDVTAILTGLFNANAKLDEIVYFLGIDDEEEEEEEEPPDS